MKFINTVFSEIWGFISYLGMELVDSFYIVYQDGKYLLTILVKVIWTFLLRILEFLEKDFFYNTTYVLFKTECDHCNCAQFKWSKDLKTFYNDAIYCISCAIEVSKHDALIREELIRFKLLSVEQDSEIDCITVNLDEPLIKDCVRRKDKHNIWWCIKGQTSCIEIQKGNICTADEKLGNMPYPNPRRKPKTSYPY